MTEQEKRTVAVEAGVKRPCKECRYAGCCLSVDLMPLETCRARGCGLWPYGRSAVVVKEYAVERG